MKKSKFTTLLLTVLLLSISMTVVVQATTISAISSNTLIDETIVITPFWENANDITLGLSFSDGEAVCSGIIGGKSGTTSISATFKLEQKTLFGWSVVKTWNESVKGSLLTFSGRTSVTKGNIYRLSVSATVVRNGTSETVSGTPVEKTY